MMNGVLMTAIGAIVAAAVLVGASRANQAGCTPDAGTSVFLNPECRTKEVLYTPPLVINKCDTVQVLGEEGSILHSTAKNSNVSVKSCPDKRPQKQRDLASGAIVEWDKSSDKRLPYLVSLCNSQTDGSTKVSKLSITLCPECEEYISKSEGVLNDDTLKRKMSARYTNGMESANLKRIDLKLKYSEGDGENEKISLEIRSPTSLYTIAIDDIDASIPDIRIQDEDGSVIGESTFLPVSRINQSLSLLGPQESGDWEFLFKKGRFTKPVTIQQLKMQLCNAGEPRAAAPPRQLLLPQNTMSIVNERIGLFNVQEELGEFPMPQQEKEPEHNDSSKTGLILIVLCGFLTLVVFCLWRRRSAPAEGYPDNVPATPTSNDTAKHSRSSDTNPFLEEATSSPRPATYAALQIPEGSFHMNRSSVSLHGFYFSANDLQGPASCSHVEEEGKSDEKQHSDHSHVPESAPITREHSRCATESSFYTASSARYDGQKFTHFREYDRTLTVTDHSGRTHKVLYSSSSRIAAGGQAIVYFGTMVQPTMLVAVKEFRHSEDDDNDVAESESNILGRVQGDKHIIRLIGTSQVGVVKYLVTELTSMDMEQQFQLFKKLHFPARGIVTHAVELLNGLMHIHTKGIIHRDIKPSNILITNHGESKIADFGVAIWVPDVMAAFPMPVCVGTPRFTSPETIAEKTISYATDIWSFGCCILYMLTVIPPWHHELKQRFGPEASDLQILPLLKEGGPGPHEPYRGSLDETAFDFLEKCLAWRWHDRQTAQQLLQHPFLQVDDDV